jgi:peptidoglycan/LPS O-acetylase OafA/YrhL
MNAQRLTYLDVMKAIAIIAVVLYHIGLLPYGYLGVDMFLVVAGFLVTRSIQKRSCRDGRWYFRFIVDRVVRLLPVLLVAGIAAMAIGWFTMLPDDYENLSESVVATNLFANNILSAITTGDYWNIANEYKPLMHTWYVGLLMQFYLVYPLLFYLAKLDKRAPRRKLLVIIGSLALLSLLVFFTGNNEAHRFYYLPARFFEFGVGGVVALAYDPSRERVFHPAFSYLCYAFLLVLMFVGLRIVPDAARLVLVVGLTAVLVMSGRALENGVTSNRVLAAVGVASYSIYVWHQVLIAFYRYIFGNQFAIWSYLLLFVVVGVVSWISYRVIERGVSRALESGSGRRGVFVATISVFVLLTGFAGWVYMNAGVVRDVSELGISVQDRHRRLNVEYTERGYQYDRPFVSSDKPHWLVVGNSLGRDFVNVILESRIASDVEVSFTDGIGKPGMDERLATADLVFVARRGYNRRFVSDVEVKCWSAGIPPERVIVVGDKSFGENNGHVYAKRFRPDFFEQRVEPLGGEWFLDRNKRYREFYGERFLDMMDMVTDESGLVQVFTPDGRFISADGKHLTAAGARFYAERIEWARWLESGDRE